VVWAALAVLVAVRASVVSMALVARAGSAVPAATAATELPGSLTLVLARVLGEVVVLAATPAVVDSAGPQDRVLGRPVQRAFSGLQVSAGPAVSAVPVAPGLTGLTGSTPATPGRQGPRAAPVGPAGSAGLPVWAALTAMAVPEALAAPAESAAAVRSAPRTQVSARAPAARAEPAVTPAVVVSEGPPDPVPDQRAGRVSSGRLVSVVMAVTAEPEAREPPETMGSTLAIRARQEPRVEPGASEGSADPPVWAVSTATAVSGGLAVPAASAATVRSAPRTQVSARAPAATAVPAVTPAVVVSEGPPDPVPDQRALQVRSV
jgi:hypothetical protein